MPRALPICDQLAPFSRASRMTDHRRLVSSQLDQLRIRPQRVQGGHLRELVEGAVGSGAVLVDARCRVDVAGVLPGPPGAVGVPDAQESSNVCRVGIHASILTAYRTVGPS